MLSDVVPVAYPTDPLAGSIPVCVLRRPLVPVAAVVATSGELAKWGMVGAWHTDAALPVFAHPAVDGVLVALWTRHTRPGSSVATSHVLRMCHGFEVVGVDAVPDLAEMIQLQAIFERAIDVLVQSPMG